uniref:Uncharacterized protein n=1 Tax=Denticeps clupeoides TaxID=299321 RepID=A0AAY4D5A1_9TELE
SGLGRRFTFQQDNDPKHPAKITKEWHHNNSVTVLEWTSLNPDLNPIETSLERPKNGCPTFTIQPELERICKEEWQRILQSRCKKRVASFPKGLMAVLDQKGAYT